MTGQKCGIANIATESKSVKNIIHNSYIEIVAGIARIHSDGGVITENEYGREITIAFPDLDPRKALVRIYYSNGKKNWEEEYHHGQKHGKSLGWYNNGKKYWEEEYYEGQLHGKSLGWYNSGKRYREMEFYEGRLHGKYLGYYDDGKKYWEDEYNHGKRIK